MARGDAEMRIRVPHDVKAWVEAQAKASDRSQTAQIVHVLKSARAAGGNLGGAAPAAGGENAALERGASINHDTGDVADE